MQRHFKGLASAIRTEQYQGREHLVVPVIALVEGVVHAMNATGPEFVSADEFPGGWDGMPVFLGHPMRNGRPVSGNSKDVLKSSVGTIFNSGVKDKKLTMEAWVDVARADESLLKRLRASDPIEVSIGAFVETDNSTGEHNGKAYKGAWHNMTPDHLALLPEGHVGACSMDMGCGVRAAQKGSDVINMYVEWLEDGSDELIRTLRDIPVEERAKLSASDFAGPNRSFPISIAEDVSAAASSLGRAKGNRDAIKRKIIAIAYRKGLEASLPDDWQKKTDQKNASFFSRIMDAFRSAQPANKMGTNDLRRKLSEALQEKEPGAYCYIEDYFPVTDPTHVVYSCDVIGSATYARNLYERAFTLDADGVVTLGDAKIEVEPVLMYEPAEGASPITAELRSADNPEGVNQYSHGSAAAAHEKAAAAHEKAAESGKKGDSTRAQTASGKALTESRGTGDKNANEAKAAFDHANEASLAHGVKDNEGKTQGAGDSKAAHEKAAQAHRDAAHYHHYQANYTPRTKKEHKNAESGAPCSCHNNPTQQEIAMKKEDLVKFLEKATDEQIAALSIVAEGKPAVVAPVVAAAPVIAEPKVAETPKPQTFAEVLATASPEVQDSINEGLRVGREKKVATIKTLKDSKRCAYSDDELNAMPQAQLDKLVTLADIKVGVDFSGQGLPKSDTPLAVPAPVDMNARICAAAKK